MKYLARIFIGTGVLCMILGLVSCWQDPDPGHSPPPGFDADGDHRPYLAFGRFFTWMAGGAVAVCVGFYFRGDATQGSSLLSRADVLTLIRPCFCPRCGKPLRLSDCRSGKQFGFLPRLLCSECMVYAEYSGAFIFSLGVLLLLRAFLLPVPAQLEALSLISVPAGVCLVLVGTIRLDRQYRRAKKYASKLGSTVSA